MLAKKNLTEDEEDELKRTKKYIQEIMSISLHEEREQRLPYISYVRNFPYLKEKPIEIKNTELGCMDERAVNYNMAAIEDDGSCQYITNAANGEIIDQDGYSIRYFFEESNHSNFILNNNYSKGKVKLDSAYSRLVFSKRIDYKFSYNTAINSEVFSDFINSEYSWSESPFEYNQTSHLSFSLYPINNTISENLNYKIGFKISNISEELSYFPEELNYSSISNDAEFTNGFGYDYNRLYSVVIDEEMITMNRNSVFLSSQLNYIVYKKPTSQLYCSIYSNFNIALVNLRSATYQNTGSAEILGHYSLGDFTDNNPATDYNFHNVTFEEGVFDFGEQIVEGSGDLSVENSFLDLSEISFGLQFDYKRFGLFVELNQEMIQSDNLFSNESNQILDTHNEGLRSVTSITNNNKIKNTYFSIGVNFKL